jgi:predicted DCC family thiol-disulfide oxidoreductase YuxK/uncharacterized membrane protein YphA (DoxX/SURF4 family)
VPDELRVASPPPKPLLVFDGDCHFCRRWIARWHNATGDAVNYIAYQDPAMTGQFPEIPQERYERAVQLILPDGTVCGGARAVFRSLYEAGREKWMYRVYERVPGWAEMAELVYDEVAQHRSFLSKIDRIYSGPGLWPLSDIRTRFIFLRGLALIYLIAFASLLGQIQGLSGSHGIVPVNTVMAALKVDMTQQHIGLERYHLLPTFAWWNASDASLNWQCGLGVGFSVLLLFGIAPAPVLFLLWCLYLSLVSVCSPFMDFQWDLLLLETGFLAIFFAPLQWVERPSKQSRPSSLIIWLLRWLIFRLMLESGCVKLLSGDASWWNLTALRVHFETQPLPTWVGWYAHQLPHGVLSVFTVIMFVIELIVPVFIFAGRKGRITAAVLFIFFQVLILLTGNYTFFNWLTILLCVPLLDDDVFLLLPATGPLPAVRRCPRWSRWILVPLTILIGLVTLMGCLGTLGVPRQWSMNDRFIYQWLAPFRSFNNYGLFAVMTQKRPEIIIEGSDDGQNWTPYEFKYKPGDLNQRPGFVAPCQPRLDWQMWFAALGGPRENEWILNLETRLLENSPEVLKLLAKNPFPKSPPKYIRAQLYEYHFTDRATRRKTGNWWRRDYLGPYLPPLALPRDHPGGNN